ncbi:hypothetical protein ACJMK2_025676 [Sinanodonta woodiana]|uniref:Uncharacterized protein n=1 Tax=Sinanodonta woodiana TaxID=1069815 RepID=A0ABD3XJ51_SINWO
MQSNVICWILLTLFIGPRVFALPIMSADTISDPNNDPFLLFGNISADNADKEVKLYVNDTLIVTFTVMEKNISMRWNQEQAVIYKKIYMDAKANIMIANIDETYERKFKINIYLLNSSGSTTEERENAVNLSKTSLSQNCNECDMWLSEKISWIIVAIFIIILMLMIWLWLKKSDSIGNNPLGNGGGPENPGNGMLQVLKNRINNLLGIGNNPLGNGGGPENPGNGMLQVLKNRINNLLGRSGILPLSNKPSIKNVSNVTGNDDSPLGNGGGPENPGNDHSPQGNGGRPVDPGNDHSPQGNGGRPVDPGNDHSLQGNGGRPVDPDMMPLPSEDEHNSYTNSRERREEITDLQSEDKAAFSFSKEPSGLKQRIRRPPSQGHVVKRNDIPGQNEIKAY